MRLNVSSPQSSGKTPFYPRGLVPVVRWWLFFHIIPGCRNAWERGHPFGSLFLFTPPPNPTPFFSFPCFRMSGLSSLFLPLGPLGTRTFPPVPHSFCCGTGPPSQSPPPAIRNGFQSFPLLLFCPNNHCRPFFALLPPGCQPPPSLGLPFYYIRAPAIFPEFGLFFFLIFSGGNSCLPLVGLPRYLLPTLLTCCFFCGAGTSFFSICCWFHDVLGPGPAAFFGCWGFFDL